eukprot:1142799-Pelagomonas_calceolata.AAC.6
MCKHPRNLKWTMQPAHASTRLTAFWQITALPHASPSLSRAAAPGAIGGATGGRATPPAVVVCRLEGRVGGGRGGGGAARGGRSVLALGSLPVRGAVVGVDDVDADGAAASRGGGGDLLLGAGAAVAAAGSFRGRTA